MAGQRLIKREYVYKVRPDQPNQTILHSTRLCKQNYLFEIFNNNNNNKKKMKEKSLAYAPFVQFDLSATDNRTIN